MRRPTASFISNSPRKLNETLIAAWCPSLEVSPRPTFFEGRGRIVGYASFLQAFRFVILLDAECLDALVIQHIVKPLGSVYRMVDLLMRKAGMFHEGGELKLHRVPEWLAGLAEDADTAMGDREWRRLCGSDLMKLEAPEAEECANAPASEAAGTPEKTAVDSAKNAGYSPFAPPIFESKAASGLDVLGALTLGHLSEDGLIVMVGVFEEAMGPRPASLVDLPAITEARVTWPINAALKRVLIRIGADDYSLRAGKVALPDWFSIEEAAHQVGCELRTPRIPRVLDDVSRTMVDARMKISLILGVVDTVLNQSNCIRAIDAHPPLVAILGGRGATTWPSWPTSAPRLARRVTTPRVPKLLPGSIVRPPTTCLAG